MNKNDLWDDFVALATKYSEDMEPVQFVGWMAIYTTLLAMDFAPDEESALDVINENIKIGIQIYKDNKK